MGGQEEEMMSAINLAGLLSAEKRKTLRRVLIILGLIAAAACAAYLIYRFFVPDYMDDFEEEFEDEFDDDFFDDDDEEEYDE